MENGPYRIVLADDHKALSDGLVAFFDTHDHIEIVGVAHTGEDALTRIGKEEPDLVIMDINMPVLDGIETTKIVKEKYPDVKVLILSMHNREGYIKNAIKAGADGYIFKNSNHQEVLTAAENILRGGTYFSQEATSALISKMRFYGDDEGITISEREKEILTHLSDGYTAKQIADMMFVSKHTIDTYRKNLIIKFEAKNVSELVKKALLDGYIT